jgi:hypothetical protein
MMARNPPETDTPLRLSASSQGVSNSFRTSDASGMHDSKSGKSHMAFS